MGFSLGVAHRSPLLSSICTLRVGATGRMRRWAGPAPRAVVQPVSPPSAFSAPCSPHNHLLSLLSIPRKTPLAKGPQGDGKAARGWRQLQYIPGYKDTQLL